MSPGLQAGGGHSPCDLGGRMRFGKRGFVFLEMRSSPPTVAQTLPLTLQMLLVLLPTREKTWDTGEPSPKNNPPKENQQIHLHQCSRSGQPRKRRRGWRQSPGHPSRHSPIPAAPPVTAMMETTVGSSLTHFTTSLHPKQCETRH